MEMGHHIAGYTVLSGFGVTYCSLYNFINAKWNWIKGFFIRCYQNFGAEKLHAIMMCCHFAKIGIFMKFLFYWRWRYALNVFTLRYMVVNDIYEPCEKQKPCSRHNDNNIIWVFENWKLCNLLHGQIEIFERRKSSHRTNLSIKTRNQKLE